MQRLSVVSKRVHLRSSQAVIEVARNQYIRRLSIETTPPPTSNAVPPPSPSNKKPRRVYRRLLLYSSALTLGVYGVGTFIALRSEQFHDFFVESVPYGARIVGLTEQYGWKGHPVEPQAILYSAQAAIQKLEQAANDSVSMTKKWIDKAKEKGRETSGNVEEATEKLKAKSEILKTNVHKRTDKAYTVATDATKAIKAETDSFSQEVSELVHKAEQALQRSPENTEPSSVLSSLPSSEETPVEIPELSHITPESPTYTNKLPIGFEAPPGFVLPSKPKPTPEVSVDIPVHPPVEAPAALPSLPLVAPAVSDFSSSEPVLAQLASTIDNLAAFLKDNPSTSINSNAKEVLETAQTDLVQLGERLQHIKDEEKDKLEQKLDEQARDYTVQLLQLEMDSQDKLDLQGEEWRKLAESERQLTIEAYRAKLEEELRAQSELINARLREEVVAQGIELQRRWIREIKVKVEEERGGRLARLDELAADLKRLSKVTLDNSAYLDENLRLHALWSSIRALNAVVQNSTVRKPFREELRILRHVAIAGGAGEDPVLAVALETLDNSIIPDIGVEPFADLASWFTTSVAPRIANVALVPDENAGILSYLASSVLSSFRFQRQGLVEGDDVLSVLSRAEYYMNEKDLDSAARELNQLRGPAKILLNDWLDAARKRLEVLQAIEVVQSQATLASLLLI